MTSGTPTVRRSAPADRVGTPSTPVRVAKDRTGWLLIGPALVFLTVMAIGPLLFVLYGAFTRYTLAIPTPVTFNGLDNFTKVLGSSRFRSDLKVTALFGLVNVLLQILVGLALAMLLNRLRWGRQIFVTLLLLPMIVAPIVVGFAWDLFLNPIYGPLNSALEGLGLSGHNWTGSAALALPTVMFVDSWQWFPFVMIILLAGLQAIPPRIYEAARVDGSSWTQTFRNVTLPLLLPYILVAFVLRFIDSFKIFDVLYILTKGGPGTRTENLGYYTYSLGFTQFDIGQAAALSLIQLFIVTVVTAVAIAVLRRRRLQQTPRGATR